MRLLETLRIKLKQFLEIPDVPAGIVVRPDCYVAVSNVISASIQYNPFGSVPLFVDNHQPEPYLEFSDQLELRAYLARFECAAYDKLLFGEPRADAQAELLAFYDRIEGHC